MQNSHYFKPYLDTFEPHIRRQGTLLVMDNSMVVPCHLDTCHKSFPKEQNRWWHWGVVIPWLHRRSPAYGSRTCRRRYIMSLAALASVESVPALAVELCPASHPHFSHQHPQVSAFDTHDLPPHYEFPQLLSHLSLSGRAC